jgi:hypothetical protein
LVADLLQKLVQKAWAAQSIAHPLDPGLSPPVLQYADDTLILCRADVASVSCLHVVLDDFSSATGLFTNFHKSCFVPMHVPDPVAASLASILGCPISSFPQPYLGLPLSPLNLPNSAF